MIDVLLMSLTGPQIIALFVVTVVGGLLTGFFCLFPGEAGIGLGAVIFFQVVLFWTSEHLDSVLYAFEAGIMNFSPGGYIGLHNAIQLGVLWFSFWLGRSVALGGAR